MSGVQTKIQARKLAAGDLICLNGHPGAAALRIALDYARQDNLLFGEPIYRPGALLSLYRDLAEIVLEAGREARSQGLRLIVHDGLRTVEAQEKMLYTQRVRENPRWLQEPRLLSPPGMGGHPRGMAVDVSLETDAGKPLDMGTEFDFLAADSAPRHNPAHREYPGLTAEAAGNRALLDALMLGAAQRLLTAGKIEMPLIGLPQEWWDYRAPPAFYEKFYPLADADLPSSFRLCAAESSSV